MPRNWPNLIIHGTLDLVGFNTRDFLVAKSDVKSAKGMPMSYSYAVGSTPLALISDAAAGGRLKSQAGIA